MYQYSASQLAIITAVPTITVLLIWTLTIFYKNKKHWRAYDICIIAILIQSILRNLSTLCYTVLTILSQSNNIPNEYCTAAVWLFNSLHTFQASTLSTLSVVGLYVIKLSQKQKEIKQYLTSTHIVYHLFCLTTLCACVGVAAILGQRDSSDNKSANFDFSYGKNTSHKPGFFFEYCQFMPYELDSKYNIFILSLHSLLALVSIICFLGILLTFYNYKKNGFNYLKKSTSDLSDLSLGAAASTVNQKDGKHYYDSYQKSQEHNNTSYLARPKGVCQTSGKQEPWTSDTSNISTSISSTNSRRPCLIKKKIQHNSGLESIMPVLIVCYLFNHLPLVVVCVFPWLPSPWTNGAGAALWLSLTQDVLIPTALGLVDGRFNSWVSKIYRCGRKNQKDRPLHGLDGKFRPFSSTTQTLEVAPMVAQVRIRPNVPPPINQITHSDPKFPITNGSLYTSIDGRLPIIHNYRRNKGLRNPTHSISMGLHSTYVKRQETTQNPNLPNINNFQAQDPSDDSFISLPADYTSLASTFTASKHNLDSTTSHLTSHICFKNPHSIQQSKLKQNKMLCSSQNSLNDVSIIENELLKLRLNNINQSRINLNRINTTQRDIQMFENNPEIYQKQKSEKDFESSDDEYFDNSNNFTEKHYDTISSQSCCSITTEANCDFEFFAQEIDSKPSLHSYELENDVNLTLKDSYIMKLTSYQNNNRNYPVMRSFKPLMCKTNTDSSNNTYSENKNELKTFRIRRSNSKQSLEDLNTYINKTNCELHRTDSNNTYDKRTYIIKSNSNRSYEMMHSDSNLTKPTNCVNRKPSIRRINFKNLNTSCVHFNEKSNVFNQNFDKDYKYPVLSMESLNSMLNQKRFSYLDNGDIYNHNYGGSVPDFKKIFITDFI